MVFGLAQGIDGNFYGIVSRTIAPPISSIFRLTPAGTYTTIFSFSSGGAAGSAPEGVLVLADDGKLYGTAAGGGGYGEGTVFRIATPGGLTPVVSFAGTNGARPFALSRGRDGCLYGTTAAGGPHNMGTVFRLTTNGILTTLFSFTQQYVSQYGQPSDSPVQVADGDLYGTTTGGFLTRSSIYRLSTNGNFTIVAVITNMLIRPMRGLAQGPDDCLYGTMVESSRLGTVFRATTNGTVTMLAGFYHTNGSGPTARLLLASDGSFYGTTAGGGISNKGTIFRLTTNGDLTTLAHFTGANGSAPESPVVVGSDHNLYGTTTSSGLSPTGGGTVFRLVENPEIVGNTLSNGAVVLTWSSFTGGVYRVEYKSSLADTNWTPGVATFTATNSLTSFTDPIGSWPQRWYRVVLLP